MSNALPEAIVVSSVADGPLYRRVTVSRAQAEDRDALVESYQRAGQYVLVRVASIEETGFFAMARAPEQVADGLEILVKLQGQVAEGLAALEPGDVLQLSDPIGMGYPLERARDCDVLVLAAGSGIGPVRAAIEVMLAEREAYGWIRLYYGQARSDDFAFSEWLASLEARGVEVHKMVSRGPLEAGEEHGYVQVAADVDANFAAPKRLAVLVCGMPAMENDARERCRARGLRDAQILTNL